MTAGGSLKHMNFGAQKAPLKQHAVSTNCNPINDLYDRRAE